MSRWFGWSARVFSLAATVLASTTFAHSATAGNVLYSNGFETDTAGWSGATRVPSGTGGVTSASGAYHATTSSTPFTTWGGYNFGAGPAVPTSFQEYVTSVDIYLDLATGWANNTRFDFSSAINNAAGNHRRDFIFNGGYYNDATGPGANTDRFVISASTNSQPGSAFAKNPANSPIAISDSGWYTFQHRFYDNSGILAVDMSILDSTDSLINSWTLSNPSDLITGIGGNRYGWFDFNEFSSLAFDNSSLTVAAAVPEPSTLISASMAGVLGIGIAWRRRKHATH